MQPFARLLRPRHAGAIVFDYLPKEPDMKVLYTEEFLPKQ
jgi:hypothetical protein